MEAILMMIRLDGPFLGAAVFIVLSAVSMIRGTHRRGALLGAAGMASYVLFAWQWYSAFLHHHPGITWFELAYLGFQSGTRGSRIDMTFLGAGLVLVLANVLGILWQRSKNRSVPTAAD